MNKKYGNWGYSPKNNIVFSCKFNCDKKHEHFIGTYDEALVYFTGEKVSNRKVYGQLINIVRTHQLDDRFVTKTSAELYNLLIEAAGTPKYWIPEEDRVREVLAVLEEARNEKLLHDNEILFVKDPDNISSLKKKRIWRQQQFELFLKNL